MEVREQGRARAEEMGYREMIVSVLVGGVVMVVVYVYERLFMKAKRVRSLFEKQGIRGPSPSFFLGNIPQINNIQMMSAAEKLHNSSSPTKLPHHHQSSFTTTLNHHPPNSIIAHDWPSTIFSHLQHWQTQYGPNFLYSTGSIQLLCITDPEMVKELGLCKSLSLGKPSYQPKERGPLLGIGIATSNGPIWAYQRKIIAPQFYPDKVKGMVNLMVESTNSLTTSWENKIKSQEKGIAEIKIDEDLKNLSADIISRACFGSNYSHGQQIFLKLRTLQNIMSKKFLGVPGSRLMPTKSNREMWRLEKEIRRMILELVKQREADTSNENHDLLQMIMEGAKNYGGIDKQCLGMTRDKFIVDNCKTIYLAGHETIAITASWSLMLLAAYPEWQARARAEVLQVFGDGIPHADMLPSLKTLSMVIHETLRLYPPSVYVIREAFEDLKLKDTVIPKGTNIQIPIPILHRIPEIWGCDSHEFNPQRFENGIHGASKIPQAYLPFGVGTRICVGQRLAHTQLKLILSLILSKFSFSLSPSYKHSLTYRLFIQPQHGINLHLRRL